MEDYTKGYGSHMNKMKGIDYNQYNLCPQRYFDLTSNAAKTYQNNEKEMCGYV